MILSTPRSRSRSRFARLAFTVCILALPGSGCQGVLNNRPNGLSTQASEVDLLIAGSRVPRLTHAQWARAVQHALLLPEAPPSSLDADNLVGAKFDNDQQRLTVSRVLFEQYASAARRLADQAIDSDAQRERLVPSAGGDFSARASIFASSLLSRAFRRAPNADELQQYKALFTGVAGANINELSFREGLKAMVEASLQSPHFLYRVEVGEEAPVQSSSKESLIRLSAVEYANRVSFTLFDRPADEAWLSRVQSIWNADEQARPAALRAVIDEVVKNPEASAVLLRFHRSLFKVTQFATIRKDQQVFPGTSSIAEDSETEANRFFAHIDERNGGLRELLLDRTTFVNSRLAKLYELPVEGLTETSFEERTLPETRAGILTRVGWNALEADLSERRTIERGVFVLNNIVCDPPGAPPADATDLAQARVPPNANAQNREVVAFKTEWGNCANCHQRSINPAGFAFEQFDAVGRTVLTEQGRDVNASGILVAHGEQVQFSGASSFLNQVVQLESTHRCYAQNMMQFLTGYQGGNLEFQASAEQGRLGQDSALSSRDLLRELLVSSAITHFRLVKSNL